MTFALVAHTVVASINGDGITSSAIDTTGADLLTIGLVDYQNTATVSDSKSNTWVKRTVTGSVPNAVFFDALNAMVGASHTFTVTASADYPTLLVAAWSGSNTSSQPDAQSAGGTGSGTTIQPGSLTPGATGELMLTLVSEDTAGTYSVDSGFTTLDNHQYTAGQAYGGCMAYKIKTDALAENPTWTLSTSQTASRAVLIAYKIAGGGGGGLPFFMQSTDQLTGNLV